VSDTKATGGIEVSRSDDEVMVMARKRLRLALEMLGPGAADSVLDESLTGAGILAHDTGDLLEVLFERRVSEARDDG